MTKYDKYVDMLKSKILTDGDITKICKEFKLSEPNFNDSHDWIFKIMSSEMLKNSDYKKFKQYITKFPNYNGLDYKKLEKQINLSGRTSEQQINDMFKTMDEANKNRESYDPISFAEMEEKILKDENHPLYEGVVKRIEQSNKYRAELCDLCRKRHDEHDLRGFVYFHGDDNLKAGWSCVEEIVRKNKRR